ncbi:outer membrane beta-barrel protein [uncultured Roseovarius sp.]|uniref:outer membrane protein n=1 Tax=uncultured Roseovarius sp. TaxID=293344 RepID=UPI0026122036|nr:outer membrane beta-barrel protein [uncultured Roseovarius sp.]
MLQNLKLATAALMLAATPAAAELEVSLYLGVQSAHSDTDSVDLPGPAGPVSRDISWKVNPFDNPLYYGGRATWWTRNNIGFGVEGTHTKAIADPADRAALGVDKLEFTDGHNIITANVMKRWPGAFKTTPNFTPYAGAGVGVAIPHVDIQVTGAASRTFDYETTGPAIRGIAGLKYALNEKWALFGEYQITWSDNDATIDPDVAVPGQSEGKLKTELVTHAVNFGISYSF